MSVVRICCASCFWHGLECCANQCCLQFCRNK